MKNLIAAIAVSCILAAGALTACGGGHTDPAAQECANPLYGGTACDQPPLIGPTGSEGTAS